MNPVIFDMDGVLVDSERTWDEEVCLFAKERGGRWTFEAQQDTMGMGSREACVYMRDVLGFQGDVAEIDAALDSRLIERYRTSINEIHGASNAVRRLAHAGVPLGLASAANRCLIDTVLDRLQVSHLFATVVSGQDVARGKPAPDIYLEAARRLGAMPQLCVAVEDSANGVLSAFSANLQVIVLKHPEYKLVPGVIGLASAVLRTLDDLTERCFVGLGETSL